MLPSQGNIDHPCRGRPSSANESSLLCYGTAPPTVAELRLKGRIHQDIDRGLLYLTAFLVSCIFHPAIPRLVSKAAPAACFDSALSCRNDIIPLAPPRLFRHSARAALLKDLLGSRVGSHRLLRSCARATQPTILDIIESLKCTLLLSAQTATRSEHYYPTRCVTIPVSSLSRTFSTLS